MKDWTGNKKSTFTCLGASNHCNHEREINDYYATDPFAAELLVIVEPFLSSIWECACGEGHLAKVFAKYNKLALASDLINRNRYESYLRIIGSLLNDDRTPEDILDEFLESKKKTNSFHK